MITDAGSIVPASVHTEDAKREILVLAVLSVVVALARFEDHTMHKLKSSQGLYGALFDISNSMFSGVDWKRAKAMLLFHDSFLVPDGYFWSNGPFSDQLLREAQGIEAGERESLVTDLLRLGMVEPVLRVGEHISETWQHGSSYGIHAGKYQTISADVGKLIFDHLRPIDLICRHWPKPMAEARTLAFADYLDERFFQAEGGALRALDRLNREKLPLDDLAFEFDRMTAMRGLESFINFHERRKSDPLYRRGEIEDQLSESLFGQRLTYRQIGEKGGASGVIAREVLRTVASVYHEYQSDQFGAWTSFSTHQDHYVTSGLADSESTALSTIYIEVLPLVDIAALTAQEIAMIRSIVDRSGRRYFDRAKELLERFRVSPSENTLINLVDFSRSEYQSAILAQFPACRKKLIEGAVSDARVKVADAATLAGIAMLGLPTLVSIGVPGAEVASGMISPWSGPVTILSGLGLRVAIKVDALPGWLDRSILLRKSKAGEVASLRRLLSTTYTPEKRE